MSNSPYVRAAVALTVLEMAPPLIRNDVLEQSSFRDEFGLKTDTVVAFGKSGISVQRSELFQAIREVFGGALETEVADVDGRACRLRIEGEKGKPRLVISAGKNRSFLPDFGVLASDQEVRLRSLEKAVMDVNLPIGAEVEWRNVLAKRSLDDDEVEPFHSDMRDTPVELERSIRSELKAGQSRIASLVPSSRRYFERLVGAYDGSTSIADYAAGTGRQFLQRLTGWRTFDGFLYSLFLSSHAALTAEIDVNSLPRNDLVRAYEYIENRGDVLSKLGAIEVGCRILSERRELEPYILGLVRQIRDDDDNDGASDFKLFDGLFVLVDGEMSRTRILSSEPPFYRRLAAMAHAALIQRQLVQSGINYHRFSEWAFNNRAEQFYMQSLADMRSEPRWHPDFAQAHQMKMDFFARIMVAGSRFQENIGAGELGKVVLGGGPGALYASSTFPGPYLPGPLEGREDHTSKMPDDVARFIEAKLDMAEVEPSSFFALVNSSVVFRIDAGHVELAARALRMGSYRLANVKDKSELVVTLSGLATVAAVTRSSALAEELRILVRRYRHDRQFGLSIDEAMRICMVASASREDLIEWRDFAGEWLTELAFDELPGEEAEILHSHLQGLLQAVPELWVSCAKADAALKSLCPLLE